MNKILDEIDSQEAALALSSIVKENDMDDESFDHLISDPNKEAANAWIELEYIY